MTDDLAQRLRELDLDAIEAVMDDFPALDGLAPVVLMEVWHHLLDRAAVPKG